MKQVLDTEFFEEYIYSTDSRVTSVTQNRLLLLQKEKRGILPAIVILERVKLTCDRRGIEEAELRYLSLVRNGLEILNLTAEIAKEAGTLKCTHKELPYGDCVVSASALSLKATLLTDDPHFKTVKGLKLGWIV